MQSGAWLHNLTKLGMPMIQKCDNFIARKIKYEWLFVRINLSSMCFQPYLRTGKVWQQQYEHLETPPMPNKKPLNLTVLKDDSHILKLNLGAQVSLGSLHIVTNTALKYTPISVSHDGIKKENWTKLYLISSSLTLVFPKHKR